MVTRPWVDAKGFCWKHGIQNCAACVPEWVVRERKEDAERQKGGNVNVSQYITDGGGERLPLLDAKMFKKEVDKKGTVRGKILAIRVIHSTKGKGWHGLALDLKCSGGKYSFLAGFDRFDIGGIARQCKSEETDDWIGQTIRFVSKKGSKGGVFVNVANK